MRDRRPVAPTTAGERLLEDAGPPLVRPDAACADIVRTVAAPPSGVTLAATPTVFTPHVLAALPAAPGDPLRLPEWRR
ncbi:hypothetical protein [Streptomyces sp. NPDC003710]